jgi:hypothetical protein
LPSEVIEVSLRWTGSDYAGQAQHQQKDIPAHANQIQRSRKSYDTPGQRRARPLRKAKVRARLRCFCFECEHVGPRVIQGHRESEIRGQFRSNSDQRQLALRGHRQFDNVSALSAITALALRSSNSAVRFCIFVAACRSEGVSARQTAILKAHSILFFACTSSGGKPLGGGSFTFTLCHLPSCTRFFGRYTKHVLVAELNANFWATSTESVALSTVNACPPARRIVGAPRVDRMAIVRVPLSPPV